MIVISLRHLNYKTTLLYIYNIGNLFYIFTDIYLQGVIKMTNQYKLIILGLNLQLKMETQRKVRLYSYKTGEEITELDQLPLLTDERTSTDKFCTIITSLFAITMFLIAVFCFKMQALQKMTYPTDSQGRHCTLDNKYFNYIYFPTPNNPSRRLCVSTCPVGTQTKLECWPTNQISCSANSNPQFQVKIYSTQSISTSMGLFCLPKDESVRQTILTKEHLKSMFNFASNYASVGISLLTGLGLALLAVVLFYFIPVFTSYVSISLGGLGCFVLATVLLVSKSDVLAVYKTFVIIFSLTLIAVGLFLFWGLLFRRNDIDLSIRYISEAGMCLKAAPWLILLSFVYIILLAGLISLCTFQILAYWSNSQMTLTSDSLYYKPNGSFPVWMTILTAFQFFWGLCFLKESLNFIVSGVTISWFFTDHYSILFPISILFRFHWGSVAGGAFLLNILYPFDIIYDLVKPSKLQNRSSLCNFLCCCQRLLDLARSQAMAMVCLIGTPYCNSARLCQQVVYHSSYTDGGQSANRFVRIGCHILFAGFATLFGWIYSQSKGQSSVIEVILCFIVNLFMLTYFVCIIKDIAQTILFCDMVSNCIQNKDQIQPAPKQVSKKLFGEGYQILRTSHSK